MLHFDIEDGHFTPFLSMGTKIIHELRRHSRLVFDVHLAVENPEWHIHDLVEIGVERISIHWEATQSPLRILEEIKSHKIKAGLVFNPSTPIPDLTGLLPYLDFVNLQSTDPFVNNGKFIFSTLDKLASCYNKYAQDKLEWVVDGGITNENIITIMSSHADVVVVGRYLFEGNIKEKIELLNRAVREIPFIQI